MFVGLGMEKTSGLPLKKFFCCFTCALMSVGICSGREREITLTCMLITGSAQVGAPLRSSMPLICPLGMLRWWRCVSEGAGWSFSAGCPGLGRSFGHHFSCSGCYACCSSSLRHFFGCRPWSTNSWLSGSNVHTSAHGFVRLLVDFALLGFT